MARRPPPTSWRPRRPRRRPLRPRDAFAQWRATGCVPAAPVPPLATLIAQAVRARPAPLPPGTMGRDAANDAAWLQRCIAAAALASAASLAPLGDADAASAQLGVSATVPLVAAMQVHWRAPTLTITPADVARGYVDVAAGARFSVATTSRDGYLVEFVPRLALFRSVEVLLGGARAEIGPDGGVLAARGRPRRDANAALSYRFRLAEGVAPGTYPFPLDFVVRPL